MHSVKTKASLEAEPTWEVAQFFPNQGYWHEQEYLALVTNHLVEYAHGRLEVLPMPTQSHQLIARFLFRLLLTFAERHGLGMTLFAPLRVRLKPGKYREPDVVFMLAEHAHRRTEQYWLGADLVMEVVSPDDRQRDLETKRVEYAEAGISEYWIVDTEQQRILVLVLQGDTYALHGEFRPGERADSVLLPGFAVNVEEVFAAANA